MLDEHAPQPEYWNPTPQVMVLRACCLIDIILEYTVQVAAQG